MKKIISLLLFALTVSVSFPAWAEDRYHGGCDCFGQVNGIDIDDCARAGYGSGTGVRVQVRPARSNGQCGADGGLMAYLPKFPDRVFGVSITDCCDEHDIGYGTCGLPQDFTDRRIGDCIRRNAAKADFPWRAKALRLVGNAYQTAVETFGLFAYRAAQSACACSPCGANLAPLCMFPGLGPPAWSWPPWEPFPSPIIPPFGGF
jgi:hypothetical protein